MLVVSGNFDPRVRDPKNNFIISFQRAYPWRPVYLRSEERWIWFFQKYTRIWRWSERIKRYRTVWTVRGWQHTGKIPMGEFF